jgi:hypothetical protein
MYIRCPRVHRIDITRETGFEKVVEYVMADLPLFAGNADHCNRARREELFEH